jgi:hypothetical protein
MEIIQSVLAVLFTISVTLFYGTLVAIILKSNN